MNFLLIFSRTSLYLSTCLSAVSNSSEFLSGFACLQKWIIKSESEPLYASVFCFISLTLSHFDIRYDDIYGGVVVVVDRNKNELIFANGNRSMSSQSVY